MADTQATRLRGGAGCWAYVHAHVHGGTNLIKVRPLMTIKLCLFAGEGHANDPGRHGQHDS
jgi:hypothetical protein